MWYQHFDTRHKHSRTQNEWWAGKSRWTGDIINRQDKTPSPKPKSRAKKPDAKRKKRRPNDVKTEQDMDAIASFDDSSRVTDSSDDNNDDETSLLVVYSLGSPSTLMSPSVL
ncbi:hypothetical protein PF005_g27645 [Phytophthora fragariae]|uniref:Uncharacterized protein n=2 Tax=Phytophthora fragariae TaxID=53985 RepID=A0A6A3VRU6_9STRA|nr:hypothetical protein PF007_g27707 [Phytophthora fragariae]KAE9170218.1 hypothetical protein PF005_g27645 [Phytophthora fragariae]KAE9336129.1 hypothetical protein PF008_g13169 [Phytophthora fragariae]